MNVKLLTHRQVKAKSAKREKQIKLAIDDLRRQIEKDRKIQDELLGAIRQYGDVLLSAIERAWEGWIENE